MNLQKLKQTQLKLAKKVILKDRFKKPVKKIAGIDQAFSGDKAVSAVVVCDYKNMEVLERAHATAKAGLPYIPGYLTFREGPAILKAYKKLKTKPDVILFDANGIIHPLGLGMASHIGILLDKPSIGVAKGLLLGDVKGGMVYINSEVRGFALKTNYKPIYVSPGHRVSLKTSLKIAKKCIKGHRLPEPIRLAHLEANRVKNENNKVRRCDQK